MVHLYYVFSFQCQDKLVKRNGKLENWATKKGHFTCRVFVGANWCDSQANQSTGNCKTGSEIDYDYNVDYYDNWDGLLFKDSQYCRQSFTGGSEKFEIKTKIMGRSMLPDTYFLISLA